MRSIANAVTPFRGPRVRIPPSPPVLRGLGSLPDSTPHTLTYLTQRLCLTALIALVATGCLAESRLVVETTPPGALVELDWKSIGHTPLEYIIDHRGKRRLLVTLDGYEPVLRDVEFKSTWKNSFPIDIFTELLNPFAEDEVLRVDLHLSPRKEATVGDLVPVLERAEVLRRAGPSGPNEAVKEQP